jgi:hypothetical protein
MTDADLKGRANQETEMFGPTDPETIRENARRVQDSLDRQGRDAYAEEYAATQILNLGPQ